MYFMALIVIATALLLLPFATQTGEITSFPVAFFTAVSALSTCGIQVVNTNTYWSFFGQIVILFSIQLGGLGVMTFASIVALGISRRLRVSQRMLTANELGTNKLSEIKSVITVVLTITAITEALTFTLLLPELLRVNNENDAGRTLWQAIFYAVSAYNNTGFTPDTSGLYVSNWGVGLPDPHQRIHRHARLPRGAERGAVRAQTSKSQALVAAHQTHVGHHRDSGGRLAGVVPYRRMA